MRLCFLYVVFFCIFFCAFLSTEFLLCVRYLHFVNFSLRVSFGRVFRRSRYLDDVRAKEGYAPLFKSFENFYTRRLYHRIQVGPSVARPVDGRPVGNVVGCHFGRSVAAPSVVWSVDSKSVGNLVGR